MENKTYGQLELYFDQRLEAFLRLLCLPLPASDSFWYGEKTHNAICQSHRTHCHQAIEAMLELTRAVVECHRTNPRQFLTPHLDPTQYQPMCQQLEGACLHLGEESRQSLNELIALLGKLLNHGLTDEEVQEKWTRIRRNIDRPMNPYVQPLYSQLQEFVDEHQPTEEVFIRYVITQGIPENEIRMVWKHTYQNTATEACGGLAPKQCKPTGLSDEEVCGRIDEALSRLDRSHLTSLGERCFDAIWSEIKKSSELLESFRKVKPKRRHNDWNVMMLLNVLGLMREHKLLEGGDIAIAREIRNIEDGHNVSCWKPEADNRHSGMERSDVTLIMQIIKQFCQPR